MGRGHTYFFCSFRLCDFYHTHLYIFLVYVNKNVVDSLRLDRPTPKVLALCAPFQFVRTTTVVRPN